ncbi:MAG: plasmid replication initiator TrfA [Methylotenera sp.]|uniref:plasmid replication initiator TrfA n=1 Tax=Methylotenera sp. TaxID=2051956 RepID=UPI002489FC79|nr:plasmid replication initiator TrfA [Methylotenera sp.]MDI1308418.1 plasmid replication initiator TrfA [Methylotenera sp.]
MGDSGHQVAINAAQQRAYLKKRGVRLDQPCQLDILFPSIITDRDDLRHIPNDYARSSLFTARNKSVPRKTLTREKLFCYNEYITILYTGIELRAEDDELVWLQILHYSQTVPMGLPFKFTIKDLVRDVGWAKNGNNYRRAKNCISRLRANEVLCLNTKAYGKSEPISLIKDYESINDENGSQMAYKMWVDLNLILLFAGNTFTSHDWELYRGLSQVARRLADYVVSHERPFPLAIEKLKKICDSTDLKATSWRQTVRKACCELEIAKIAKIANLGIDDKILFVR